MVTALIKKYIIGIQNCCLCYRSYDFEYRTLISITIANGGIRFHISSLSKGKKHNESIYEKSQRCHRKQGRICALDLRKYLCSTT